MSFVPCDFLKRSATALLRSSSEFLLVLLMVRFLGALLDAYVGFPDHLRPLGDLGADEAGEFLGRAHDVFVAAPRKPFLHVRSAKRPHRLVVEPAHELR